MSQSSVRSFRIHQMAVARCSSPSCPPPRGHKTGANQRAVGGIIVDPERRSAAADGRPNARNYWRSCGLNRPRSRPNCNLRTELRKVSLRALEAALTDVLASNQERLPDEVIYLAGLQRVQYILVYPEQNDIVLAGPGEGWKFDDNGNAVGVTTGLPAVRLDDLLVAFRTVEAARTEGISRVDRSDERGPPTLRNVHEATTCV